MVRPEDGEQIIYQNFKNFYTILNSCAQKDINELGLADIKNKKKFINAISASNLYESGIRSYILGFIKALIEDGERFSAQDADWMRYYTVRTGGRRSIGVSPLTIEEFNDFILILGNSNYFVFLDEFHEEGWCVYVRNLLRCTGLMCVVASTNSKISNLTGMNTVNSSRSEGSTIWAAVITKLPPTIHDQIIESYHVEETCEQIIEMTIPRDKTAMRSFLNFLSTDQIKNLRPGIAEIVFSKLSDFCEKVKNSLTTKKSKVSLQELMTFLFESIAFSIDVRKKRISSEFYGRAANISLLLSNSFCETAPIFKNSDPHRNVNFINDHLYYLVNPVKSSEWAFLVHLEVISNDRILQVIKNSRRLRFEIFSYLKESEFILTLSCMFIPIDLSTSSIMHDINRISKTPDVSKYPNPNARGNSGNSLETRCLVALIDSSHRSGIDSVADNLEYDFILARKSICGVRGDVFIMNLLSNLFIFEEEESLLLEAVSKIEFLGNSERALKSILVPFLTTANMKIPDGFASCLSGFQALTGKCLKTQLYPFIEPCSRTPNSYQIDGEFSALFYSDPITINADHVHFGTEATIGRVVVEIKDNPDALNLPEYFKIILKSQSYCKKCKIAKLSKRCNNCSNSKEACSDCIVRQVQSFPRSTCTSCNALEASSYKCKLHFLFCNSITKPPPDETKKTVKKPKLTPSLPEKSKFSLSEDQNLLYNFFRIQIDPETRKFSVAPLMDNLVVHEQASVTFIVFEMDFIDEEGIPIF